MTKNDAITGEIVATKTNVAQLKKSSKTDAFVPTAGMKVFLYTALRLMSDNVAEISREADLDESNWYKWQLVEGFKEWYNTEWNKQIRGHSWKLDVIGMKNARKDFNYWKTMRESMGKDHVSGGEITFTWRKTSP